MTSRLIDGFGRKTWAERFVSARFHLRQGLAKLSYAPVPVHLQISEQERIDFWWSYVVPYFEPARGFFDYWGHDLAELRFLWGALKPGMVFLDIGAYHGIYSLVAARRVGSSGQVIAFEPSPREFARLRLHFRWNQIRNARAERCAVGAAAGEQTFFQVSNGDHTRSGFRRPASGDSMTEISVRTILLDEHIAAFPLTSVDIVKLDVEGAELEALRGGSSLLTRFRPIFICEVLDTSTQPWGYDAREIVSTFLGHNFAWFEFQPGGGLTPHSIQERYPEVRNYLAVPKEKLAYVQEKILK